MISEQDAAGMTDKTQSLPIGKKLAKLVFSFQNNIAIF